MNQNSILTLSLAITSTDSQSGKRQRLLPTATGVVGSAEVGARQLYHSMLRFTPKEEEMTNLSRELSEGQAVQLSRRDILSCARQLLESHSHFCVHSGAIRLEGDEEILILGGRVPSFHLKQLAQEALRSLRVPIENQIDVVCSAGLSSTGLSDQSIRLDNITRTLGMVRNSSNGTG